MYGDIMTAKLKIILRGLAFPESPRWHGGKLWFSDMHAHKVMTVDLKGKTETVCEVPLCPSGLGWTREGRLLIVSMKDRKLMRFDPTGLTCVADLNGLASGQCNDMVTDALGRAYIGNFGKDTNLGKDFRVGPAEIVMVTPDGKARVAAGDVNFPNGMVITPDSRTLIVAESFASHLTSFTIAPDGSLTNREVWAVLDKNIMPDGICLDAEGAVWVGNAGGPAVYRVKRGGEVIQKIETSANAYACMLGGADRRTLFIMTAESTDDRLCREKMTGRIEIIGVEVPGAGLP
jgi:sugar lactone lactonase YvrE